MPLNTDVCVCMQSVRVCVPLNTDVCVCMRTHAYVCVFGKTSCVREMQK